MSKWSETLKQSASFRVRCLHSFWHYLARYGQSQQLLARTIHKGIAFIPELHVYATSGRASSLVNAKRHLSKASYLPSN